GVGGLPARDGPGGADPIFNAHYSLVVQLIAEIYVEEHSKLRQVPNRLNRILGRGSGPMRVVELRGFEPLTSSMPWKRATNCAIAPLTMFSLDDPKSKCEIGHQGAPTLC